MADVKTCTLCLGEKPISEFYYSYGKHLPRCRECLKNISRDNYNRDPKKKVDLVMKYQKKQYATNPVFKLKVVSATRIRSALKTEKKSERTMDLIGCSPVFLSIWLRLQFLPGMTWDNHGTVWDIDHIIPCAHFKNLDTSEAERRACFNYTNLRPCWLHLNRYVKRDHVIDEYDHTPIMRVVTGAELDDITRELELMELNL